MVKGDMKEKLIMALERHCGTIVSTVFTGPAHMGHA